MSERKGTFWRFVGRIIDSLSEVVSEKTTGESRMRSTAEQMLQILDLKADAVSFAMARADEAYERLQTELENHEGLGRQAEQFLRDRDEEAMKRCLALQLQSAKEVTRLTTQYEDYQREAEDNVATFRQQKEEVAARLTALPQLENDERFLRMQEKVQRTERRLSLETPQQDFDRAAQELRIRQQQLRNRELLSADPNAQLDRRIRESVEERKLEEAVAALRNKVDAQPQVVEGEIVEADPVRAARRLLEAPRYKGIPLLAASTRKGTLPKGGAR